MKAIVLEGPGLAGLKLVERPRPEPGAGEVLVHLRTAALNHRDLWICRGRTAEGPPVILGSDGAGVIAGLGEGVAERRLGEEVVVNPSLNWQVNAAAPPEDFEILGDPTDGTLAEYVVLPAGNVEPKPEGLSWRQAAALPLSGLTAYRALFSRGGLRRGETVIVPGVGGGTALTAFLFAKAAGARTVVTSTSPEKRARAAELGADLDLGSAAEWAATVRDFTGGRGADLVVESVGRATWTQSLACLARGGRLAIYGSTSGDVVETDLVGVFLRWISILGTTMGSREEFRAMLAFVAETGVKPVVDRLFPLDEGIAALHHLDAGDQFGKVVIGLPG